tara:strand:- start:3620 stop:4030 length:411 start_codon:yes stop_codon:yes gene_type:complete
MKKFLLITFIIFGCSNLNEKSNEIGSISILNYPEEQELERWIKIDSGYKRVFQVRKYFEFFVNDSFFEDEENISEFNELKWSTLLEYQNRYFDLVDEFKEYIDQEEKLTKFVDSVIMSEYPKINDFTQKIFKLGSN